MTTLLNLSHRPIYVRIDGDIQGPFTSDELSALWRAGDLDANAMFWVRNRPGWSPVAEFASHRHSPLTPETVLVVTTQAIATRPVDRVIGAMSAHVAIAFGLVGDALVSVRDLVGGRSPALEGQLRSAHGACIDGLRADAARLDCDAVLATSFGLTHAGTPGNGGFTLVSAVGTAVQLGPPA